MRLLRKILPVLLMTSAALAQANKTRLDNGVTGQLDPSHATDILTQAQTAALIAAQTAGSSAQIAAVLQAVNGAGSHRGISATTGYTESFVAEGRCSAGTTNATGFDYTANLDCSLPGFYHATGSNVFDIERTFTYGVTNAQPPAPTHFGLTVTSTWGNTIGSMGISTCPVASFNCGAAHEVGITWNSSGLVLLQEGTGTVLWSASGNGPGHAGTMDSSTNAGWSAPAMGGLYSFSIMLPGDGSVIVSAMPAGANAGTIYTPGVGPFVVRIPVTLPSGSFHSFFVRGGVNDYVSDVSAADGFALPGGIPKIYDILSDPRLRAPHALRWALHPDGSECNYTTIYATPDSTCTNVYAYIPPNYHRDMPNPWWLQIRGEENSTTSFLSDFANANPLLFQEGMVGVYGDWHGTTWYGAPPDLKDIANAQGIVRSSLSLAVRPHVLADSGGGVNTMSAVTHGMLLPEDIICVSCNLNLLSDVQGNNATSQAAGGGQLPFIANDYGFPATGAPTTFSANASYPIYTSGFDPLQILLNPTTVFTNSIFDSTMPLVKNPAQLLASIPLLAISDSPGGDAVVDVNSNSVAFCAADNVLNPGICQNSYIGGGHVSANKVNGFNFAVFMNSHP